MQVATLNCAKGAVPESSSQVIGTYAGIASSPATRKAIEGSDCLLTVGYRRVETTVGFFTDNLPASTIHLNSSNVDRADALLGAILACPGRRHILLTGEGSLQMTVQELSTVIRHDLKPFIFVINNSGYTVERAVLGKDTKYNDVANWRYSELPNVFSRDKKAETYVVQTSNELQKVLDSPHSGMVFVECVMDKYDAPIDLIIGGRALADSDYGVPGSQSAANSQIPLPRCATTSS
jgi:TPP-dependent 2-oxoacid decarboxylase